jgi:hypothetical protein
MKKAGGSWPHVQRRPAANRMDRVMMKTDSTTPTLPSSETLSIRGDASPKDDSDYDEPNDVRKNEC